jgi:hypothetical protein
MGWLKFVFSLPGSILISSFISSYSHAGTILITEQEANLPQESVLVAGRAITRGPSVQFVQSGATVHSPIHFQVRFQAFGGSKINLDTLRMIYLKTPEIDLVPRVIRFTQRDGIDILDAEIPPGEHYFRIEISDTEGRIRSSIFELKVLP